MDFSYKNDLIKLRSYINKKKIIYSIFIKDRSILTGLRFIEKNNKIIIDNIPKKIKKSNIENIKYLQKGDILIKLNNNICVQTLENFTKLINTPNIILTFLNPKLYTKQFKMLNRTKDDKLIRQRFYKYQLHVELIDKTISAIKIQKCYRSFFKKQQKKNIRTNLIKEISQKYINKQLDISINYHLNGIKLATLIKKLYFSKLIRDKQQLKNETDILKSINHLNQNNIESLKYENDDKDDLLLYTETRHRIKCKSLLCKYSKDKLDLDETYHTELNRQWNTFEKQIEQDNLDILITGILLRNKKKNYIFKLQNNNIELVNCKNNKINKYTFDQIKYILAKNNDSIIIINENSTNEYYVENKYRNLIVNYFNSSNTII